MPKTPIAACSGLNGGLHFLDGILVRPNVKVMPVHFSNSELQTKLDQWANDTGRSADELVEDAVFSYFDELARLGGTLDSRLKSCRSKIQSVFPDDCFGAE